MSYDYARFDDWKQTSMVHEFPCECCGITSTGGENKGWKLSYRAPQGRDFLCPDCYQREVLDKREPKPQQVTRYEGDLSKLEPIKEWSDDLVGRRVVCISDDGCDPAKAHLVHEGLIYTLRDTSAYGYSSVEEIKDGIFSTRRFAILPDVQAEAAWNKTPWVTIGPMKFEHNVSWAALGSTGHKFRITFETFEGEGRQLVEYINNEVMGIYPVCGSGLEGPISAALTKFERCDLPACKDRVRISMEFQRMESTHVSPDAETPETSESHTETTHSGTIVFMDGSEAVIPEPGAGEGWGRDGLLYIGGMHSKRRRDVLRKIDCNHFGGESVVREWATRIRKEGCTADLIRWTRTITPEPQEPTMMDRAMERFPMLYKSKLFQEEK